MAIPNTVRLLNGQSMPVVGLGTWLVSQLIYYKYYNICLAAERKQAFENCLPWILRAAQNV